MVTTLLHPWTTSRTWRALGHALLDLPFAVTFGPVVLVFLALSVGLFITFPLALPFAWLAFVVARGYGRLERSRVASLLDVHLGDPHPPLAPGSWWAHLKERVRTPSRWREIAYPLLHLPVAGINFAVVVAVWAGSLTLLLLPLYAGALPRDRAEMGLFEVHPGVGAWTAGALGLVGVVLLAPWTTLAVGAALARWLLGPSQATLHAQVARLQADRVAAEVSRSAAEADRAVAEAGRTAAEAHRSAAVGSAQSERNRIERDLHDGAQQRLVALAMDLGMARERFDEHPEAARALVVEAHEEAKAALAELRDLVRGFQPSILEARGLDAALSPLVARSPVPVRLQIDVAQRPSMACENAAYYVVAEALTNVAKHARATLVTVAIARRGDRLAIDITDDGGGGAEPSAGTGLRGLDERVRALGGWTRIMSPVGGPTTVMAELPCAS